MRQVLIHRPLLLLSAGLVLGLASLGHLFAVLLLGGLLFLLRDVRSGLACVVGFALGAVLAPTSSEPMFPKQWVDLQAHVVSVPKLYPDEVSATIETSRGVRLQMGAPPETHIGIGETIHVKGDAKPLSVGSERLSDRGIVGRIWAERLDVVDAAPWVYQVGQGWRDSFVAFADAALPARAAAATEAVCFNVQSRLDDSDRESFSRAGTVHAISTSGLHVGLIALVLFGLLSLLPIPRSLQLSLVAAVLVFYAIASGLHPPVVRAALLMIVLSSAYLVRREPDLLSAIGLAAVVQLLWDSTAIYDVGFQLTFVVLVAVGFFPFYASRSAPVRYRKVLKVWQKLRRYLIVVGAAAPLAAYQFGSVSLTSVVANLSMVFALPALIVGALVAHLVSFVSGSLAGDLMSAVVGPLAGWLLFVTDHLGGEWAALDVPAFSGYWLFLVYGIVMLMWRERLRPA